MSPELVRLCGKSQVEIRRLAAFAVAAIARFSCELRSRLGVRKTRLDYRVGPIVVLAEVWAESVRACNAAGAVRGGFEAGR
jgi:hypothetical protein